MSAHGHDWIGLTIADGRYQILRKLGEGGMAFVYLAQDTKLRNAIVIKAARPELVNRADFDGRFRREISSLCQLSHPNILKVFDLGKHQGIPFAVLQYLPGGSLRDRQPRDSNGQAKNMSPASLHAWLAPVAAALDFIHTRGYIHRDIKPDNLLFDEHNHVFLSDFGIAKVLGDERPVNQQTVMTQAGMAVGTPQYMAPELILGKKPGRHVDQYALAVTIYELLSGRYPFDGPNPTAIFVKQVQQKPPSLSVLMPHLPEALSQIIERGLAKKASDRFATCSVFADQILSNVSLKGDLTAFKAGPPKAPVNTVAPTRQKTPIIALSQPIPPTVLQDLPPHKTDPAVARLSLSSPSKRIINSIKRQRLIIKSIVASLIAVTLISLWLLLAPTVGSKRITNSIGMELIYVGPGSFLFGSPDSEKGHEFNETQHEVTVSKGFYLSKCEVTQDEYEKVMGINPSAFSAGGTFRDVIRGMDTRRFPVESVRWQDAKEFCQRLSTREGKKYRLPTEAEWEMACRSGTVSIFNVGQSLSSKHANIGDPDMSKSKPKPVGSYAPNRWGFCDMHGNVAEWCEDIYLEFYLPPKNEIDVSNELGIRSIRGGGFRSWEANCRAARRFNAHQFTNSDATGFRIVQTLETANKE